ncbi:sulfotransferase domain-containing protein [Mameliella alba]|nr:sulfotransferase domain-containing protein [Antarctobacter heliothermus]MBY6147170.1 sulfotransferase domain-containing protein [Mameliella alba]MBY6172537.1 sulfotransferase domain-containing protein [Mameliella alba]MCA0957193.1 sulfotransferase domain-containing protein [Mameliella alba]
MKHHVVVATYHKTGTVWMNNVFRTFCAAAPASFHTLSRDVSRWKDTPDQIRIFQEFQADAESRGEHAVIFENHCNLPPVEVMQGCRGFRVVRDPRDVLISAANYHVRSDEAWLHAKQPKFGGMTYAEKINSLDSFEDRILFEMDHVGGETIVKMAHFDKDRILETVKYEDLVTDTEMTVWTSLMRRIGLEDTDLDAAAKAFWQCSLFGGMRNKSISHQTSGSPRQWYDKFSDALSQAVEARFGKEIETLGYAVPAA